LRDGTVSQKQEPVPGFEQLEQPLAVYGCGNLCLFRAERMSKYNCICVSGYTLSKGYITTDSKRERMEIYLAKTSVAHVDKKKKGRADVLKNVLESVRKEFGDTAVLTFGEDNPAPQVAVVPTGIASVDKILGTGGLPRGRFTEIFGPEGSGKTTLALHVAAQAQENGGTVLFIDAEHALDPSLARSIGVVLDDSFMVAQPDSGEQALKILNTMVSSGGIDVIILDSVAALTPQAEIDGNIGESQVGLQARLMSTSLRQINPIIANTDTCCIFINQLRAKISTGYSRGPQETTTGGRALKFYSSVRIEVKRGKSIKVGEDDVGHALFIKAVKNKLAPPFKKCECSLIYGKGISWSHALAHEADLSNVLKRRGGWYKWADTDEVVCNGLKALTDKIEQDPEFCQTLKDRVYGQGEEALDIAPLDAIEKKNSEFQGEENSDGQSIENFKLDEAEDEG